MNDEDSHFLETLIQIKRKCKFLWCVLASGSIADRTESGTAVKYLAKKLKEATKYLRPK